MVSMVIRNPRKLQPRSIFFWSKGGKISILKSTEQYEDIELGDSEMSHPWLVRWWLWLLSLILFSEPLCHTSSSQNIMYWIKLALFNSSRWFVQDVHISSVFPHWQDKCLIAVPQNLAVVHRPMSLKSCFLEHIPLGLYLPGSRLGKKDVIKKNNGVGRRDKLLCQQKREAKAEWGTRQGCCHVAWRVDTDC